MQYDIFDHAMSIINDQGTDFTCPFRCKYQNVAVVVLAYDKPFPIWCLYFCIIHTWNSAMILCNVPQLSKGKKTFVWEFCILCRRPHSFSFRFSWKLTEAILEWWSRNFEKEGPHPQIAKTISHFGSQIWVLLTLVCKLSATAFNPYSLHVKTASSSYFDSSCRVSKFVSQYMTRWKVMDGVIYKTKYNFSVINYIIYMYM
jgi:hypothetical protein